MYVPEGLKDLFDYLSPGPILSRRIVVRAAVTVVKLGNDRCVGSSVRQFSEPAPAVIRVSRHGRVRMGYRMQQPVVVIGIYVYPPAWSVTLSSWFKAFYS